MKHVQEKEIQDIIDNPGFGNLAKLATTVILAIGLMTSGIIVVARGGDMSALKDGLEIFTPFFLSALAGGAVNTFGDSETARFIKKNGLPVEEREVVKPVEGVSLPANHPDIQGNFKDNADTAPALLSRD